MKGFRFRLEPILVLRKNQEDQLHRQLSERQRELDRDVAVLEEMRNEIARQELTMGTASRPGALDLDGMLRATGYVSALKERAVAQEKEIERRARIVEDARAALIAATTDRKSLERLKENQSLAFEQEIGRKEQRGTEEMATTRYLRRNPTETEGR